MRLGAPLKFMVFAVIMTVLTGFLIMVFGNFRGGSTGEYSAVFADTSRLKAGDSVRVAGVVVGTVDDVALQQDHKVVVSFAIDRSVVLTEGTQAAVRYLNLVGDRYLELRDAPGPARLLAAGAQIPVERTEPALDLQFALYLSAEEDHYFHTVHEAQFGCPGIDLWRTSAPAYGEYNGTYSAFMFNHEITAVLQQHNASVP